MDEVLKSFKAQMYDRVSSPLTFSFLLSWCLWNYRFLLVIVGTSPAAEKFAYIEQHLFVTWHDYLLRGFLLPLISSLFYIYLYPTPARKVYEFSQSEAVKMKKAQQNSEDQMPISPEDAANLRAEMRKEKRERAEELEKADKTIKQLKDDLARLEVKPSAADKLYPSATPALTTAYSGPALTDGQHMLLHTIANYPEDFYEQSYYNGDADLSLARRRSNVDALIANKLLTDRFDNRGKRILETTPIGRHLVVSGAN